jgi:hypothetical protein
MRSKGKFLWEVFKNIPQRELVHRRQSKLNEGGLIFPVENEGRDSPYSFFLEHLL